MNAQKDELLNVIRSWFKESEKELIKRVTSVLDKQTNLKHSNKLRAIAKTDNKPVKPKTSSEESEASESEAEVLPKKRVRLTPKAASPKPVSKKSHSESEEEQLYEPPPMVKKLKSDESEGNSSSPPKSADEQGVLKSEEPVKAVESTPIKQEPKSESIQDEVMKDEEEKIFDSEDGDEDEDEELFKTESSSAEDEEEKEAPLVRNDESVNKLLEELRNSIKDSTKVRKILEKFDKIFEKLDLDCFKIFERTGLPKTLRGMRKEIVDANGEFLDKMLKRWKDVRFIQTYATLTGPKDQNDEWSRLHRRLKESIDKRKDVNYT
jgi:hypothetical protein